MVTGAGVDHKELRHWNAKAAGSENTDHENISHDQGFHLNAPLPAKQALQTRNPVSSWFYSCSRSLTIPRKAAQEPWAPPWTTFLQE